MDFIRVLLKNISYENNKILIKKEYKELNFDSLPKKEQSNEFNKSFRSKEDSLIVDLIYIQFINLFTCKCNYNSYSFEKLIDIY